MLVVNRFTVELRNAETIETNCFGEDWEIDWSRSFTATDIDQRPPVVLEGEFMYIAPAEEGDAPQLMVDFYEVEEATGATPVRALQLLNDDEFATNAIVKALPAIISLRNTLRSRFTKTS